jgi:hypothetical protein
MQRHGIVGFRSPALLMTPALWEQLRTRFAYDSSVPDSDVEGVTAPRRGCSTVFPFHRRGLLELPLTLPLDDRLLLLGQGPRAILTSWQEKLRWIDQVGGIAVVTTHVEPHLGGNPELRSTYNALLDFITHRQMTTLLPREVTRLWQGDASEYAE